MIPRLFVFALALVFTQSLPAAVPVKGKFVCTARELQRQDCRLTSGTYRIRLLSETIARNDGTWHTVDPMPLKGEGVQWEKVRFEIMNGWPILQLWLWDSGSGEAPVQSLRWYVTDAKRGELSILSEGIVRRRRLKPVEAEEAAPAAGASATSKKNPSYIYDGWEKHSLKLLKDGSLAWLLRDEKKILRKANAHGL